MLVKLRNRSISVSGSLTSFDLLFVGAKAMDERLLFGSAFLGTVAATLGIGRCDGTRAIVLCVGAFAVELLVF